MIKQHRQSLDKLSGSLPLPKPKISSFEEMIKQHRQDAVKQETNKTD
jgi:hypothetical protein